MEFSRKLASSVDEVLYRFIDTVSETYNIDKDELINKFNEITNQISSLEISVNPTKPVSDSPKPKAKLYPTKAPRVSLFDTKKCEYIIPGKGSKPSKQCSKNSINGSEYCSIHNKIKSLVEDIEHLKVSTPTKTTKTRIIEDRSDELEDNHTVEHDHIEESHGDNDDLNELDDI